MEQSRDLATQVDDLLPRLAVRLVRFVKDVPNDDITLAQGFLLRNLEDRGRCRASEIAEMMGITSGPVTSITRRLLNRGLIHRFPDENDRRVVWFTLTDDGKTVVRALKEHSRRKWQIVIEELGAGKSQAAIELMEDTIRILGSIKSP